MPTVFDIKDKVIALTGAGQGIGYATTKLLTSQGAIVSMADVNETTLKAAADEFTEAGGTVMATVLDVTDEDSVDDWIKKTVEKFGKLDGAVNLAGIIPSCINKERVEEHNTREWKQVLDVNVTGVFFCMRAQLQQMNNQGSIVNASSLCGGIGFPKNAAYTASKHAVIGLSRAATKEVGDREIRINCICPGIIDGPMQDKSRAARGGEMDWKCQIKRRGTPLEVANLITWLLCGDSKYITGQAHFIDGGWYC